MNTIYSCGIKINPLTASEILCKIKEWQKDGRKNIQITGVNLEQIALLKKDKEFSQYVNSSDIVNIDGTIVYLYLKLKGYKLKQKTLCADILYEFLNDANKNSDKVYFLGAAQDTIEILVNKIKQEYPNINIAGYHNGFYKDDQVIVDDISNKHPKYLFIGMPSPQKEKFITNYKEKLNTTVCFGVGGMFDIIAGKAKRAPLWVQKSGLEWLYRITQNPVGHTKRIFRALIPCLLVFCKYLFEPVKQDI